MEGKGKDGSSIFFHKSLVFHAQAKSLITLISVYIALYSKYNYHLQIIICNMITLSANDNYIEVLKKDKEALVCISIVTTLPHSLSSLTFNSGLPLI